MRDYARVSPQFWIGSTGKAIRKRGMECQMVALYLMTSPHSNMLGLYYLPVVYIANDTGMTIEGASKALARLSEEGFCTYDNDSEMVWVHEMAIYQIAESLAAKDKQVLGINKALKNLPKCPQILAFYEKYKAAFHLENPSPSEGPSKPLRSKEQEQEKEQDADQAPSGSGEVPDQQQDGCAVLGDLNDDEFAKAVAKTYAEVWKLKSAPPIGMVLGNTICLRARSYEPALKLVWWQWYFEECLADEFLNGTKNPKFIADLPYLVSEKPFASVINASHLEAAHG
jgi:hypothetical protein